MCKCSNVLSWPVLIGRGLDQKRACFSAHPLCALYAVLKVRSMHGPCRRSSSFKGKTCTPSDESRVTSIEFPFLVVMARGNHPFPSRTRQLSPSAPMVLAGRPVGRVGHCKEIILLLQETRFFRSGFLVVVVGLLFFFNTDLAKKVPGRKLGKIFKTIYRPMQELIIL